MIVAALALSATHLQMVETRARILRDIAALHAVPSADLSPCPYCRDGIAEGTRCVGCGRGSRKATT